MGPCFSLPCIWITSIPLITLLPPFPTLCLSYPNTYTWQAVTSFSSPPSAAFPPTSPLSFVLCIYILHLNFSYLRGGRKEWNYKRELVGYVILKAEKKTERTKIGPMQQPLTPWRFTWSISALWWWFTFHTFPLKAEIVNEKKRGNKLGRERRGGKKKKGELNQTVCPDDSEVVVFKAVVVPSRHFVVPHL